MSDKTMRRILSMAGVIALGFVAIASYEDEAEASFFFSVLAILFFVLFMFFKKKKPPVEKSQDQPQLPLQPQREIDQTPKYEHLTIKLVGVSFNNDDQSLYCNKII